MSSAPDTDPFPPVRVRPATRRDLRSLVLLYRGQEPESRTYYHPYPFDRLRLPILFLAMLSSQAHVRWMLRRFPNYAFVILLLIDPEGMPFGFGTIRFVHARGEAPWARFGFLVDAGHRHQGAGSVLVMALYESAVGLGVHRGGGTILEGNVASAKVVEKFGFRLRPAASADPFSPDKRNLTDIQNLDEVLEKVRRVRAERGLPATQLPWVGREK